MGVDLLARTQVVEATVLSLGLDPKTLDLEAPEVLAAVLRRTASFHCPIGSRSLVDAAMATIAGLAPGTNLRPQLVDLLQAMLGSGDLIELAPPEEQNARYRLIYLSPPTYVRTLGSTFVLMGVRPEGAPLVDDILLPLVQYERHTRKILSEDVTATARLLAECGLHEVDRARWLRSPPEEAAESLVARYERALLATSPSGEVPGLQILDAGAPVDYYRGRWRGPVVRDNGFYVGRREQAFGSDLWCYVRIVNGVAQQIVDLPASPDLARGCDEAWRLQAAIDSLAGHRQRVRVERSDDTHDVVSLFSPPPNWLQRRWDGRGLPVASRGALVSYVLTAAETLGEVDFVRRMLWLEEVRGG